MKKLLLVQNSLEWLNWRESKMGGSSFKDLKPLSRGPKKDLPEGAAGFWKMLSAKMSLPKRTDESDMDRGHRMEAQAIEETNRLLELDLVPGSVWVSDDNEDVYVSADAEQNILIPLYAQETKAFDRHKHLNIIYEDIIAKRLESYSPLESVPKDNLDQIGRYFRVNDSLEILYWVLVSDRFAFDKMNHYIITINREDVTELLEQQNEIEKNALAKLDVLEKLLIDELS